MTAKILVVDDEPEIRFILAHCLERGGHAVVAAGDGAEALATLAKEQPDVVLMDLTMPRMDGMQALREIRQTCPNVPVIIGTALADVPTAVEAMRRGAYDFLTKPFNLDLVLLSVERAVKHGDLLARIEELQTHRDGVTLAERMGPSAAIHAVIRQVAQVARAPYTVLVLGETGTGKELVARAIHRQSARASGPFVVVDCGAIPETLIESELFGYERGAFTGAMRRKEGQFQLAQGGTLFLDEIGNVSLAAQAKLLRVLEEREVYALGGGRPVAVDVRVIAASNVRFDEEIRAGHFRADLYYRLSEFTIPLPPLRDRREDIAPLAQRFLAEASMELKNPVRGLSEDALAALLRYDWPGNVRELKNVVRKAALLGSELVTAADLPPLMPHAPGARPSLAEPQGEDLSLKELAEVAMREAERSAIRRALQSAKGNKSQAARLLRTDYTTIHSKMKRYGISARDFMTA